MVIQHNLTAMNSQRQYSIVGKKIAKSTEKLSSGYRINRAADDAAGLAISEKMRRQIRGLTQGVENTQDGVSMCQVGDGALAEVSDMLHRITELSVKAANGTLDKTDREAIQKEITQILEEVDRIGDSVEFNDIKLFEGNERVLTNADGTPFSEGSIPFSDFSLADATLGGTPLSGNHNNTPALKTVVNNPSSAANGKNYNLIFGSGSTSNSSIRVTTSGGEETVIALKDFKQTAFTAIDSHTWEKTLTYKDDTKGIDIEWKQEIATEDTSATEKNYIVKYLFQNNGTEDIEMDAMFHTDTAYNNNDRCEGYFIDKNRVNAYTVYAKSTSTTVPTADNSSNANVKYDQIPASFSIVDVDKALPFSEKVTLGSGADEPDVVSIGFYNSIDEWNYYDSTSLSKELGKNAKSQDLGFSFIWEDKALTAGGGAWTTSFKYGIVATESDTNLDGVTISNDPVTVHESNKQIWIQSGCDKDDGMYIYFGEMNSTVLGIKNINVTTEAGAKRGIDSVARGLKYVSNLRATIGAQQNRLEHTISNESNVVENTQAAESVIRDTDMAAEMVRFSTQNILAQAGQAMLSQANQSNQGVLALLQ